MIIGRSTGVAPGDRGSISVELAILAPLVGVLLIAVVAVGRMQIARADLEGAARAAARDLSISRDPGPAIDDVRQQLERSLDVGSPSCREMTLTVTTDEAITVTVTCLVDLDDAAMLPLPASMTLSATASEVIDVHRESTDGSTGSS